MRPRGAVVVFAKSPRPGLVKTRMVPPLAAEEAAELYSHMLDDVLAATAAFAAELDLSAHLCVYPEEACRELLQRTPERFRVFAQRGRDLGERMEWAAAEVAAGGARPVLLRGSDSPTLELENFQAVLAALDDHDLSLCPDLDGGYNLVGLGSVVPGIFDHPMSTGAVLEQTLDRARSLGLRGAVTPACFDLDTVSDLAVLADARRQGRARRCPRTLAYLDQAELWRHSSSGDSESM